MYKVKSGKVRGSGGTRETWLAAPESSWPVGTIATLRAPWQAYAGPLVTYFLKTSNGRWTSKPGNYTSHATLFALVNALDVVEVIAPSGVSAPVGSTPVWRNQGQPVDRTKPIDTTATVAPAGPDAPPASVPPAESPAGSFDAPGEPVKPWWARPWVWFAGGLGLWALSRTR